jgi:hypothetical protein
MLYVVEIEKNSVTGKRESDRWAGRVEALEEDDVG